LTGRTLLLSPDGALRAPWRLSFWLVATLVGVYISVEVARVLRFESTRAAFLTDWMPALGVLAGTALSLRVVDRRPWSAIGLGRRDLRARPVLMGLMLGALAIGLACGLLLLSGWLRPESSSAQVGVARFIAATTWPIVPAALAEELVFRGYAFGVIRDSLGWPWALASTSVLFGAVHLTNFRVLHIPVSWEPIALVMLAGCFLGAVLLVTGSLYAAWAAHAAWNWTLAVVVHAAVSGIPFGAPGYRIVDAGPDWATGGAWGPEGGAAAAVGMGLGLAFLVARRRRRGELAA
jgi:membrane protease YdiL (CAAX protease family)